jgi:hypothetical protein
MTALLALTLDRDLRRVCAAAFIESLACGAKTGNPLTNSAASAIIKDVFAITGFIKLPSTHFLIAGIGPQVKTFFPRLNE